MKHSIVLRVLQAMIVGYVLLALVTRVKEAAGAYTCGCDPGCWCKKPGLSLFRRVFPRGHTSRSTAEWKRAARQTR